VIVITIIKGASMSWWKFRHNRHHAKPNIIDKDPDLRNEPLFIFGKELSLKGHGSILTPFQCLYWWFLGPPLVTFVFFMVTNIFYVLRWKLYWEFALGLSRLYFYGYLYGNICDNLGWNVFYLYCVSRIIESVWFTYVTGMNHFPMTIQEDSQENWVTMQLSGTQNISEGRFNSWFTGHLNYQIEHHLFPTMPRHNYHKISSEVREFVTKHGINYEVKSLKDAAFGIHNALAEARDTYNDMKRTKTNIVTVDSR